MNENPGRRRNVPGDPTAEPASDPVPTGEEVVGRDLGPDTPLETPRRYDEPADDVVMPSDDPTQNTRI